MDNDNGLDGDGNDGNGDAESNGNSDGLDPTELRARNRRIARSRSGAIDSVGRAVTERGDDSGRSVVDGGGRGDDSESSDGESGSGWTNSDSDGNSSGRDIAEGGGDDRGNGLRLVSGNGGSGRAGKRGRHPNDCPCENCAEKRNAQASDLRVEGSAKRGRKPRDVSYDSLSGEKTKIGKNIERDAISIALTVLYESPKFVCPPGTADHWALDDSEEKTLIDKIQDVIAMLPKAKRTRAMKFIGKIMPPLALGVTAYMITKPRIDLTRSLMAKQPPQPGKQNATIHAQTGDQSANGNQPTSNVASGGNGHGQTPFSDPHVTTEGNGRDWSPRRSAIDDHFSGNEALN